MKKGDVMRKAVSLLLIALVVLSGIWASGSSEDENVIELTFWNEFSDGARYEATVAMIDKFNAENPGIRIVNRPVANDDYFMTLRTAMASGDGPDIVQTENLETLWQFVRNGYILDISDWYAERADRFVDGTISECMYDGKVYGIPLFNYAMGVFYNTEMLEEYGIESIETWDEFLDACQKFKDAGIAPIALGNKYGWPGYHLLSPLLVRNVGAKRTLDAAVGNGEAKWNDPDFVDAVSHFEELNDRGFFTLGAASDDSGAATALFISGRAPFIITGTFLLSSLEEAPPSFTVGVAPFPQFEGQKGDATGISTISFGVSLSSECRDVEAGLKFLDTISRLDVAEEFVRIGQLPSCVKGAVNNETANPLLVETSEKLNPPGAIALPFLDLILPAQLGEAGILATGSSAIITGEMNTQEWLDELQAQFEEAEPVLKQNMY